MVYFDNFLLSYTFKDCLAFGMQNGDAALSKQNSTAVPASSTVNSGTAINDADCSSIY